MSKDQLENIFKFQMDEDTKQRISSRLRNIEPSSSIRRRKQTWLGSTFAGTAACIMAVGAFVYVHNDNLARKHDLTVVTNATAAQPKLNSVRKITFISGASNVKKLAKFHVAVPGIPQGYNMQMKLLKTTGEVPQQVWFTLSNRNEEETIKVQEYPRPNPTWSMPPLEALQGVRKINVDGTSVTMVLPMGKFKSYTGYQFLSNGMCYRIESPVSLAKQVISSLVKNPKHLN